MLAIAGTATTANAQDKLDRALREGKRSGKAQRVIIKAKPGYEAWARQLLAQHGKNIDAELPSIGALAVELSAGELDTLQELGVRRAAPKTPMCRRARRVIEARIRKDRDQPRCQCAVPARRRSTRCLARSA